MVSTAHPKATSLVSPGRSLWRHAWLRLRANRAAVASTVALAVIVVACGIGPALSPHPYDAVYRSYVKVPASLEAHRTNFGRQEEARLGTGRARDRAGEAVKRAARLVDQATAGDPGGDDV